MILGAWTAYLISTMLYVLPSGLPQPSAALLALVAALFVLNRQIWAGTLQSSYLLLIGFLVWCTVVSIVGFGTSGKLATMTAPLFYAYNMVTFVLVTQLALQEPVRFARWTRRILLCMLVLQALVVHGAPAVDDETIERAIGTFNNPNQLGYWALLAGSTYMLLPGRRLPGDLVALAAMGWLILTSASKAGLVGAAIIALLWMLGFLRTARKGFALVPIALCIAVVAVMLRQPGDDQVADNQRVDLVVHRLDETTTKSDNTLGGRGYTSLLWNIGALAFGAGEGDFEDVDIGADAQFHPGEFHSTLGNVLFSYGVIGLSLFLAFLAAVVRRAGWGPSAWLLPSLVYGLAHQGLRFSPFWILLAVVAVTRELRGVAVVDAPTPVTGMHPAPALPSRME